MNRKERLASIIEEAQRYYVADCTDDSESEYIAEWLLSSGVVVPRILAGDYPPREEQGHWREKLLL